MKTLLLILLICTNLIAGWDCFKTYSPAVDKIDNIYKKAQYRHSLAFTDRYVYEIYPTLMFPFFCAPTDTVKKLLSYGNIYSCGTTIGLHLDKENVKHIQISVLQYIRVGNNTPGIKTYTMYFFKQNMSTKDWDEERAPLVVTLRLKKDGSYTSK